MSDCMSDTSIILNEKTAAWIVAHRHDLNSKAGAQLVEMIKSELGVKDCTIAALKAENERLRSALRMISAETKESNEPIGRSVYKALATCGEVADLALSERAALTRQEG